MTTPGRNTFFENLWRGIQGWMKSIPQGVQRPRALVEMPAGRELSLEIPEYPIRNRAIALETIAMVHNQPEAGQALRISAREIFSSEDGDDQSGVTVSPWIDQEETIRLRPDLYEAATKTLRRVFDLETLYAIAWRMIAYGDCFASLSLSTHRSGGVHRVLLLPTWEMFRIENNAGELLGYEQRRTLDDRQPIQFHPGMMVHWRHNRQGLYGRSQFAESLPDWREYQRVVVDLSMARREIGLNPIVYQFGDIYGATAMEDYKNINEEEFRRMQGVIGRLYIPPGVEISRLNSRDPDLKVLVEDLQDKRMAFVRASELPLWQFSGFDTTGAADIAGQPALSHSRLVNHRRQQIGQGIRQVLLSDLVLQFGLPVLPEIQGLRLKWPEFHVRAVDTQAAVNAQIEKDDPDAVDTLEPARDQLEGVWRNR